MLDFKTIERIRKSERLNRAGLSKLPDDFYEDCQEAMDEAFKRGDYDLFRDLQRVVQNINEVRQGKILNIAIFRSARFDKMDPVFNILPHEEKMLSQMINVIHDSNDALDLILNGYYSQNVRR